MENSACHIKVGPNYGTKEPGGITKQAWNQVKGQSFGINDTHSPCKKHRTGTGYESKTNQPEIIVAGQ
jgi:hypothetical protein